ncbi:tRNA nucleotidyltransferase [Dendryphion nanum]|uniref:tRNA nucleotidyltransferase n=1 Tax=Dendryphion nanum TaxID=256645 RepID=A0A9P9IDN6_9PLEO|nr:tRNA nucleotidyltransferase [Dendryphion nanum]
MTSQSGPNPTTLELNETETKLRQLLLDVAAYIDDTVGEGSVESAVKVPDQLTKEKIVLRFTGGWVRDKLLGVESHDIDVAINKMTGEHFGLKIIEYLDKPGNAAKYGLEPKAEEKGKGGKSKKIAPGLHKIEANPEKSKNLETATTKILGLDIDLVNLRKETYNEISRNPEIEFGTPEEDAMRRDATINAMFYNLNTQVIEDFTGCGFEDMAAKIIRTPLEPYQTFKDDPLRVLRLIRFASRLNYTIDSETQKAMSNDEIGEVLKIKISRERVGIELEKMLKGPDPLLALQLIDKLGLYNTIFTDPTRDLKSEPDTDYFSPAYAFVNSVVREKASNIPETIGKTLTGNAEEQYLAWICATVMPWADAPTIPHQKPTQRPYYAAYLVAREGFKAPNKVCDVIAAALRDGEEIRKFVDECHSQLRRPNSSKVGDDAAARDTLGMAVRRWGATWRSQVLFSLIYELVLGSVSRESILQSYTTFLDRLISLEILDAYTFKPLITGTELAKALNTKPGPWMKDALDVVMAWQLRNPSITDPAEAVEAVKESKTSKSELSSCLATHFLTLTVRSLFSQDKNPNPTITPAGNKAPVRDTRGPARYPEDTSGAPWKDPKNSSAIDLLKWSIASLDSKAIESNWHLIIPPILKMTDDLDTHWKATGCDLLTTLLTSTPPSLLKRTGLNAVFEDTLFPFFTYLPTLTPEPESIVLLSKVHPALLALANAIHPSDRSQNPPPSSLSTPREKFLDRILRDGFLAPLFHAPPSAYPRLATMLLEQHNTLVQSMGIDAVKHLQALTSLLSTILAEPLGLAYVQLMVAATKSYRVLIQNTWPRIGVYKGEIMRGVGLAWIRCCEDGGRGEGIEKLKGELNEVVEMLDAVFVGDQKGEWEEEKLALVKADEKLGGLLRGV